METHLSGDYCQLQICCCWHSGWNGESASGLQVATSLINLRLAISWAEAGGLLWQAETQAPQGIS